MGTIRQNSVLKGLQAVNLNSCLIDLFRANAVKCPDQTALYFQEKESSDVELISFEDLDKITNQYARVILNHVKDNATLIENDPTIAVCLPPSPTLIAVLLAIWKSGQAYLPLDICSPKERTKHVLTEAKPLLVITNDDNVDDELYQNVKWISKQSLEKLSKNESDGLVKDNFRQENSAKKIAIILYTSGSTGISKGVRVSEEAVLNRLEWQWRTFPFTKDENTCIFKTALTFVDSVSEIWAPLLFQQPRSLVVVPKAIVQDPRRLITLLDHYKIQRLVLVPTLLRSIIMCLRLSKDKSTLQRLRLWVCSGEPLPVELANKFLNCFNKGKHILCNFYGSTEVMGDVTYHVIEKREDILYDGKVPIGLPVDNVVIYLLDKQLKPVSIGERGELYAAGANLASGYVNNRDPERFIENPHTVDPEFKTLYKTGDYAKIVKGTLIFEGRTDSQVKVRGHRVDLSEVEAAISKVAAVKKAVVLCYKPGEINQTIVAFVLPEDGLFLESHDLETMLLNYLPTYAMPQVVVIENLPLLVNGKVDRQKLLKNYDEQCRKNDKENIEFNFSGFSKEKLETAECLFATISSILGNAVRSKLNYDSSFYSIGGNSLNSVFAVTELKDKGYFISITDFINAKNFGELVNKLKRTDDIENELDKPQHVNNSFRAEMLCSQYKEDVYRIITDSFYEKADLERWIEPKIERHYYKELMDAIWEPLVEKNLSFVVLSENNEVIGTALNFDIHDEPEVYISNSLLIVFNFLEYLEGPIRERKLPQEKGKVIHSFMMGTDKKIGPGRNVEITEFMEEENLRIAKLRNFQGIFTTNTNLLTQQLATDVFNYTVLHEYQVNNYVASNGTRPFYKALDEQKVTVCFKNINM